MYSLFKKLFPKKFLLFFEPQLRWFVSLFYSGNNFYCPLCEHSSRKFILLKNSGNADLLCPNCGSIQRKRLLWIYLKNEMLVESKPLKILHFSPHRYFVKKLKSFSNLNYTTTDFGNENADKNYNITSIPENDNSFDLVICYHVLEHISDDKKAMSELYRILKPSGTALLQVPFKNGDTTEDSTIISSSERLKLFGQEDHVRLYGLDDFVQRLQDAGFTVEKNKYAKILGAEKIKKNVLNEDEIIFVCRKKNDKSLR